MKLDRIDNTLRVLMLIGFFVDVGGQLGVRTLLAFPALVYLFFRFKGSVSEYKKIAIILIFFVLWPALQILNGSFNNGDLYIAISQFFATAQFVVIYIALANTTGKILLKEILSVLFVMQIVSLVLYFGAILKIPIFTTIIMTIGKHYDGGYFGFLLVGDKTLPQAYFKTTLFFIFSSIYFFGNKNYMKSLLSICALFFALSKAGTILSIIGVVLLIMLENKKIIGFILILIIILLAITLGDQYFSQYTELRTMDTTYVRQQQIDWFYQWIYTNPFNFIFGNGLGTPLFISNNGIAYAIELDHIDIIRKYGLIWSLFILFFILAITIKVFLVKRKLTIPIAFLLLFFGLGTNPLILTSVFFIFSLCIYKIAFEDSNEE